LLPRCRLGLLAAQAHAAYFGARASDSRDIAMQHCAAQELGVCVKRLCVP